MLFLLIRLFSYLVGFNLIVLCMALDIGCLSLWFVGYCLGSLLCGWVCG